MPFKLHKRTYIAEIENGVRRELCLLELRRIHYHPYLQKAAAQCEVGREKEEKWYKHKRSKIMEW